MTNGNRKIISTGKREKKKTREKMKISDIVGMITSIAGVITAGAALVVSVVAFQNQSQYTELEYRYKLKPEIDMQNGNMDISVQKSTDGSTEIKSKVSGSKIKILQKNNLRSAYLIHDNYEVEKLELENVENELEANLNEQVEFNTPNMIINGVSYHYEFVLLEGLDDSYELFLIYLRSGKLEELEELEEVGYKSVSGAEIIELEKAHMDEDDYAGERELAKKYLEILEECEKYIVR